MGQIQFLCFGEERKESNAVDTLFIDTNDSII